MKKLANRICMETNAMCAHTVHPLGRESSDLVNLIKHVCDILACVNISVILYLFSSVVSTRSIILHLFRMKKKTLLVSFVLWHCLWLKVLNEVPFLACISGEMRRFHLTSSVPNYKLFWFFLDHEKTLLKW